MDKTEHEQAKKSQDITISIEQPESHPVAQPKEFDWSVTVVWPIVIVLVALVIGSLVKVWMTSKERKG